ncbi:MAG: hypothetical protein IKE95_05180 [Methanobrevibacter sp.]|nr:hypothetical protein [Methanobrevibacter sp.]
MSDKDKEIDIDEEIKKLSRKTDINIRKSEYSFNNRLKKLDAEIDKSINDQLKDFDKIKKLTSDYLSIDYSSSTIQQYREKLKKM